MGLVRLLLSLLVVGSHFGGLGEPAGGTAVASFFAISGFLMARTIRENYEGARGALRFYANRCLRILPPFVIVLAATALLLWARESRPYLVNPASGEHMMPDTNFPGRWLDLARFYPKEYPIVWAAQVYLAPQAWSLVVEGVFYLCAPLLVFLARRPWRPLLWLMTGATLVMALTSATSPLGNMWLRSPVASAWVFILGVLAYVHAPKAEAPRAPSGTRQGVVALPMLGVAALGLHWTPVERAALFLSPVLVVAWLWLGGWATRRGSRLDRLLGNLAYGVFIGHFLSALLKLTVAEWAYEATGVFGLFGVPGQTERWWRYSFYVAALAGAAAIYYGIERPFERLRARLRAA